ncbi:MAG TPA: radical SAM protein [Candidatus Omnitrophota bacterium]|nr:radical SAM protein [Candidatus Omnitrophota bacterium]HPS20934.1 radical SAM protein [Candidatus Omnitrophota bacterium]
MDKNTPRLVIADKNNKIYDCPRLEGCGMKAGNYFRIDTKTLVKLHKDSELFALPDRLPVGYDAGSGQYVSLKNYPFRGVPSECRAVAAFIAPGYTVTYNAAYSEDGPKSILPLFSYAAVVFYRGGFYAAGVVVDKEKRQVFSPGDIARIGENVKKFRKIFPKNRLVRHLESCALRYGCPAGKNFFLSRYECPLPTSPVCNSNCIGCISYQPDKKCPITQPRIKFKPKPEEIAEVALFHIERVKDPVVSFGQGCEGEPLMSGKEIEKAVSMIRARTSKGMININTNASLTAVLDRLYDAGIDSMRVSMNSVREEFYNRYYNPRGYVFKDVVNSIKRARLKNVFVSVNYLVMPGFSDSRAESGALFDFIERNDINMIQWRNLNYDPRDYFQKMRLAVNPENMIGMDKLINDVGKKFPCVMKGYFNPSKGRIRKNALRNRY